MKRLPALLAAALAASLATAACESAPPSGAEARHFPPDEDLAVMLRYLVEDGQTPGVVLGIVEADGSTRVLHHGTAGPGARALGPRSVFEIGSINKTFTGTILAGMAARGEVALSDPVWKYLPEGVRVPSRGGREITLLDLATHRSGLPRMPGNFRPADHKNPYASYTTEMVYEFLSGHELRRDIGSEYEYSNLGMGLLGHALARAAGKSFPELVGERVLEPLGMRMTGYAREGELAEWLAEGHDENGNVVPYWDLTEAIAGAGGLRSNVEDMLTYLRANLGHGETELERAMRDAHRVRHRFEGGFAMGLGWAVREQGGRTLLSHGGGTGGFRTMIGFDPERRVGFVLLANSSGFEDDLGMELLRRGPPLEIPEAEVGRDVLASYAGQYELAPGRSAIVRLEEDGTMTIQLPGRARSRMYAESDSSFFLKRTPWRLRFTRDGSGGVSALVIHVDGTERTARRVSDHVPPRTG